MKKILILLQALLALTLTFVIIMSAVSVNTKKATKANTIEGEVYIEAAESRNVREVENSIDGVAEAETEVLPDMTETELQETEENVTEAAETVVAETAAQTQAETAAPSETAAPQSSVEFYASSQACYVPWSFDASKAATVADGVAAGSVSAKDALSDALIVGDSIMQGFSDYKITSDGNVIASVGAFLNPHLYDNMDSIINYNPKYILLHYGLNEMDPDDTITNAFIKRYKECIQKIQAGLPGVKIIVCVLTPVGKSAVEGNPRFGYVDKYNKLILGMCQELGVGYYEDSELFTSNGDLYGKDGIHIQKKLYLLWVSDMIRKMGIY